MSGAATTASVEVLTAEVRTLMVGSRQVTLSVYKQLDRVNLLLIESFGRVHVGKLGDHERRSVQLIGRDRRNGVLVRCEVTCHSGEIEHWDGSRWHPSAAADSPLPEYDGRTLGELELEAWDNRGGFDSDGEPLDLPLIVLAGLR